MLRLIGEVLWQLPLEVPTHQVACSHKSARAVCSVRVSATCFGDKIVSYTWEVWWLASSLRTSEYKHRSHNVSIPPLHHGHTETRTHRTRL